MKKKRQILNNSITFVNNKNKLSKGYDVFNKFTSDKLKTDDQ